MLLLKIKIKDSTKFIDNLSMFYCQRMPFDEILHHYIAPRKSLQKRERERRKNKEEKKSFLKRQKVTQGENGRIPKIFLV